MFISDISKVFYSDKEKSDKTILAKIKSKIIEDDKVTGYKVALGDETETVDAERFVNADVGDLVTCTRLTNGAIIVTGRQDGDGSIETISDKVDGVANDLAETNDEVDALQSIVDNSMTFDDTNGLIISSGNFFVQINAGGIFFRYGATFASSATVAYMTGDQLEIMKGYFDEKVRIGESDWEIYSDSNDNLTFKYVG